MRVVALSVAILTATTAAVASADAAGERSTTAYVGNAATTISGTPPRWMPVPETCSYQGGWVQLGRRHRAITTHFNDGVADGFALIQRDGSWAIYEWAGGPPVYGGHAKLVGIAVKRGLGRWDIVRSGRKIGHTVGPDGPEAATAALTIC
jgi:hypothetical protein